MNADGYADLVVHVMVDALQLLPEADEAELRGRTVDGLRFRGRDTIRLLP